MIPAKRRLGALPAIDLGGGLVVHQAVSAGQRRRGLAGLSMLPEGRALHLRPCRAVHTFGMRFALDLVWLDGAFRVVRVDRARAAAPAPHVPAGALGGGASRRRSRSTAGDWLYSAALTLFAHLRAS